MATRNIVHTVTYLAWDTANNVGKTGDNPSVNHTLKWVKDGALAAVAGTPAEVDATDAPGIYKVALTADETNCNIGVLCGKSSTAGITIVPLTIQFERLPDAAPAANGGLPTVDANNHINGVQDTLDVNVVQVSGDATAANNMELMFDGTGYAGGTTKLGVSVSEVAAAGLADIWETGITESYAIPTATECTPAQLLYMVFSCVGSYAISGDKITTYDLPGSGSFNQAMRFDMDDATNPTSRTRDDT